MWRTLLALMIFLVALPVSAERLFISTEEYPPYNFRDTDGQPSGVYMDQLKIIFQRTDIDYEATILPWARALALAETKPMHCVVAAARTPGRENQFKWVSPIHTDRNVLVARSGTHMDIKTLDDAKAYTIGTQRTDYTEAILRSLGFPRIDLSADFDKTLSKLTAGRIDLMPMSESALKTMPPGNFVEVVTLSHQILGMACNRSVPNALISKMQHALDDLIADGSQRRIYEKYGLVIRP
ncbi:substrate-binding periplasmic protein [Agrobacterium rosae]|uniref:ABC transporter substrate-binding protein n=1 Tax=Agrobacterium rosae TaxID=1972867 RepID=A0AAE5S0I4_9HYPH|nr:transporter substrate-binding domain-containing protein [Agrobacterium rosae]KAA3513333.1 ABC transporter substrate-binding protein [Agrobacterium rosae]KAA3521185.1 ABC transporter substrate-binding protein [Agrobacterium rosae]MCM2432998.1 amino acid ABC transporter substrate-binding protein [Agrobacterium rosae]MDX8327933.1 transporter substrate-binding domain-containing protein [Agrobacterium rosae]MQB48044.1 ABC transporter substrate-binding protein [Agrobacterium rosae]